MQRADSAEKNHQQRFGRMVPVEQFPGSRTRRSAPPCVRRDPPARPTARTRPVSGVGRRDPVARMRSSLILMPGQRMAEHGPHQPPQAADTSGSSVARFSNRNTTGTGRFRHGPDHVRPRDEHAVGAAAQVACRETGRTASGRRRAGHQEVESARSQRQRSDRGGGACRRAASPPAAKRKSSAPPSR